MQREVCGIACVFRFGGYLWYLGSEEVVGGCSGPRMQED